MGSVPKPPRDGGVSYYPADAQDLDSYRQAVAALAHMRIPMTGPASTHIRMSMCVASDR